MRPPFTPRANKTRFLSYDANGSKGIFTPDPDFYLKGLDFSCVSPWNSSCGRLRAGTAISPRHIIFAKHFPIPVGSRLVFVPNPSDASTNPPPETRTLTAVSKTKSSDIMIGLLDTDLPPTIRPAKILPVGFEKWMPLNSTWPVVTFDQHERAYMSEATATMHPIRKRIELENAPTTNATWKAYTGHLHTGDSGNPAFLIINNEPVLLHCLYSGGCGFGPSVHEFRDEVEAAMDALRPGHHLTTYSFE